MGCPGFTFFQAKENYLKGKMHRHSLRFFSKAGHFYRKTVFALLPTTLGGLMLRFTNYYRCGISKTQLVIASAF